MKRILCKLLSAALGLCLLAGGLKGHTALAAQEQDVFSFLGEPYAAFAEQFDAQRPVAVYRRDCTMAGGPTSYLWDADSVQRLFDILSGITVGRKNGGMATDSDYFFGFVMADGETVGVAFNQNYLIKDGARYEVSGSDALWAMPFPAYQGAFDLFDLCFDETVAAFASQFDEEPPVSVRFRSGDGAESVSTDPALIAGVYEAMRQTRAVWIETEDSEGLTDAVESVFTFTMADGREFVFPLYTAEGYDGGLNDYFAVQPPLAGIGTQYYLLESTDALWVNVLAGYEDVRIAHGATKALLPLYGAAVETLFSAAEEGTFQRAVAERKRADGTVETVTFEESDYGSAGELAHALAQMGYLERESAAPESETGVTLTFTAADGRESAFEFIGEYAVVPEADGGVGYYAVRHSAIDEQGVWDVVQAERSLLEWKHEVDFQGGGNGPTVEDEEGGLLPHLALAAVLLTVSVTVVVTAIVLAVQALRQKRKGAAEESRPKA